MTAVKVNLSSSFHKREIGDFSEPGLDLFSFLFLRNCGWNFGVTSIFSVVMIQTVMFNHPTFAILEIAILKFNITSVIGPVHYTPGRASLFFLHWKIAGMMKIILFSNCMLLCT